MKGAEGYINFEVSKYPWPVLAQNNVTSDLYNRLPGGLKTYLNL